MLKHIQNSETIDGVTYTLAISEEDIPVRGNAMSSGDAEADRKYEDEILERLQFETWAWCTVWVTAGIDCEGIRFTGDADALGCCSYRNAADFMEEGGYYQDMKNQARKDLMLSLEDAIARGQAAAGAQKKFEKTA